MDIKLEDVLKVINTCQPLKINTDNGESFYPSYAEVMEYGDCYVTNIRTCANTLEISTRREI